MQPLNPGLIGRCVKKPVINAEDQRVEKDVELKPHNQDQELAVLRQIKEKHAHLKYPVDQHTPQPIYPRSKLPHNQSTLPATNPHNLHTHHTQHTECGKL